MRKYVQFYEPIAREMCPEETLLFAIAEDALKNILYSISKRCQDAGRMIRLRDAIKDWQWIFSEENYIGPKQVSFVYICQFFSIDPDLIRSSLLAAPIVQYEDLNKEFNLLVKKFENEYEAKKRRAYLEKKARPRPYKNPYASNSEPLLRSDDKGHPI